MTQSKLIGDPEIDRQQYALFLKLNHLTDEDVRRLGWKVPEWRRKE